MIHGTRNYDAKVSALLGGFITFVMSGIVIGLLYTGWTLAGRF